MRGRHPRAAKLATPIGDQIFAGLYKSSFDSHKQYLKILTTGVFSDRQLDISKLFILLDREWLLEGLTEIMHLDMHSKAFAKKSVKFLSDHWHYLMHNHPHTQWETPLNQLCWRLAQLLEQNVSEKTVNQQIENKKSAYQYLMPTLRYVIDYSLSYGNLSEIPLHHFVLSDNRQSALPVAKLNYLNVDSDLSSRCIFRNPYLTDLPFLSQTEIERLFQHSKETMLLKKYWHAAQDFRTTSTTPGAILVALKEGLWKGSVMGTGTEYEAGLEAQPAVDAFVEYLNKLPDQDTKDQILSLSSAKNPEGYRSVKEILDVLVGNTRGLQCVKLRSDDIGNIIADNKASLFLNGFDEIEKAFNQAKNEFQACCSEEKEFNFDYEGARLKQDSSFSISQLIAVAPRLLEKIQQKGIAFSRMKDALEDVLWFAVENNQVLSVKILLEKGFSESVKKADCRLLLAASLHGHKEIVEILLAAGADANVLDADTDISPLYLAAQNGHIEIVDKLLKAGARVNVEDDNGFTPLHTAAYEGHTEVAKQLLAAGADINYIDSAGGATALFFAVQKGHVDMAKLLLKNKANTSLLFQTTPDELRGLAVQRNVKESVENFLVQKRQNALCHARSHNIFISPEEMADIMGHPEISTLIRAHNRPVFTSSATLFNQNQSTLKPWNPKAPSFIPSAGPR